MRWFAVHYGLIASLVISLSIIVRARIIEFPYGIILERREVMSGVLLLTGTVPGEAGVGGVILRDAVKCMGAASVRCAWLAPRTAGTPATLPNMQLLRVDRRYDTAWRPWSGLPGEMVSAVTSAVIRPSKLKRWAAQITAFAKENRCDRVVAVLESRTCIQVARLIQESLALPVSSIVWDDVQLFMKQCHLDRWSARRLDRDFATVLRRSEHVAVICENMQKAYQQRYAVDSFVLRHATGLPIANGQHANRSGEFRIGFAGSITAPDCFEVLIQTLDRMDWRLGNREIVLRLLGSRYTTHSRQRQRIEFYGWRDANETQSLLADCDTVYLPQSFESSMRFFSELSFPTKLSTYVTANRPILLHAPEYASLADFWRANRLGPHVRTLEMDGIQNALEQIANAGPESLKLWSKAANQVALETLGAKQFESGVLNLLGIHEPQAVTARDRCLDGI